MQQTKKNAPSAATPGAEQADNANQVNEIFPQNTAIVNGELVATITFNELEDFAYQLRKGITNAECLMYEITYEYLNQKKEVVSKNNYHHLWGRYDEYSIKANIVTDYLFSLRQLAEKAEAFVYADLEN